MKQGNPLILMAALACLAAAPAARQESPLDRFSPQERRELLAGRAIYRYVEDGGSKESLKGHAASFAVVNAPIEECFKIFCDVEKERLYFPKMKSSRIVRETEDGLVVHKELFFVVAAVEYTHLMSIDHENHRVNFVTLPDEPNTVKYSRGYFGFEKIDLGRTLFSYHLLELDVGFYVPEFIKNYLASKDLPGVAENVKKRIESGGKWTKD